MTKSLCVPSTSSVPGAISEKDTILNNDYKGDFFAGVTVTFRMLGNSEFFKSFPTEVKSHMANCCLVDENDVQFFQIFSLYRHELDDERQDLLVYRYH